MYEQSELHFLEWGRKKNNIYPIPNINCKAILHISALINAQFYNKMFTNVLQ